MSRLLMRVGAALVLALFLALPCLQAPAAHAASGTLTWDQGMIYSGQNNNNPMGPVGENAIVHGSAQPNQQLALKLVSGDASQNPEQGCTRPLVTLKSVTTDGNGKFSTNFKWPAAAGKTNANYSLCSYTTNGTVVAASAPFLVLSSGQPAITISAGTVAPGGTITVTGQNWVPPQPITVNIAGCAACNPGNTEVVGGSTNSSGTNSGTFSMTLKIPENAKPGNYLVDATSNNGLLDAYYTTGARRLAIAPPQATPSATSDDSQTPVSATPAASATATVAANTTTAGPDDTTGGPPWLLIVIVLLLLGVGVGSGIYTMRQRAAKENPPARAPSSGAANQGQLVRVRQAGGPAGMPGAPRSYASTASSVGAANLQAVPGSQANPQVGYPGMLSQTGAPGFQPGAASQAAAPGLRSVPGSQANLQGGYPGAASQAAGLPPNLSQSSFYGDPGAMLGQAMAGLPPAQQPGFGQDSPWSAPTEQQTALPPSAASSGLGRLAQPGPIAGSPADSTLANRGMASRPGVCARCGSPLAPDELFCGTCGMPKGPSAGGGLRLPSR